MFNYGLGIFRNLLWPNNERKKKEIIRIFKSFPLFITVRANVTSANCLDVIFDLTKDNYKLFRKPTDEPVYINRHFNHPPNIVKQIQLSLRIQNISSNQSIFNSSILTYKEALTKSVFNGDITYTPAIWFYPAYSLNVQTNLGKTFLNR